MTVNSLNVVECLRQIESAKGHGRRTCKIKVSQVEYFKEKKPVILLNTKGVFACMQTLAKLGYECDLDKTDKQVTVGYDLKGAIKKCVSRDLHTTNLVIKW